MEPEVRIFLKTIVQTVSMGLLWMMVHTWLGIKEGLLFPEGEITLWHWVYYLALVLSFLWVLRYVIRKWKQVPKFGPGFGQD
jgi:hypothetical protein